MWSSELGREGGGKEEGKFVWKRDARGKGEWKSHRGVGKMHLGSKHGAGRDQVVGEAGKEERRAGWICVDPVSGALCCNPDSSAGRPGGQMCRYRLLKGVVEFVMRHFEGKGGHAPVRNS